MFDYDLPPSNDEYVDDGPDSPDSERYLTLRKWVAYSIQETFRMPLKRSETSMEFSRMSNAEKNAIKYSPERLPPPELTQRMEDNIVALCAGWVSLRLRQLLDPESNVLKSLCNVPIDENILLYGLVLLTKSRDTGLLFFKDAERSEIHGVKEEEMPGHWQWTQSTQTWSLSFTDVSTDVIAGHMKDFLKKKYGGVYEDTKKDREVLAHWFKTMWRGLRGSNAQDGKVYRDRNKKMKEKVEESSTRTESIVSDFRKLRVEIEEMRNEISILRKKVLCLEIQNLNSSVKQTNCVETEAVSKKRKPHDLAGL